MRTLAEMSCGGIGWNRLSVHLQLGVVQRRGHKITCIMCTKSFVTWMMDLGRISLDDHELGKNDVCLGVLHGSYIVGAIRTIFFHELHNV